MSSVRSLRLLPLGEIALVGVTGVLIMGAVWGGLWLRNRPVQSQSQEKGQPSAIIVPAPDMAQAQEYPPHRFPFHAVEKEVRAEIIRQYGEDIGYRSVIITYRSTLRLMSGSMESRGQVKGPWRYEDDSGHHHQRYWSVVLTYDKGQGTVQVMTIDLDSKIDQSKDFQ
jgi:hypothetical protein